MLEWWLRTRVYLAAVSCLLLSIIIAAPVAFAVEKLRISYASVTGNTAIVTYVAQRAGLFEKYGLDVEIILITGGLAAVSALLNGDVYSDLRAPIAAIQGNGSWSQADFFTLPVQHSRYDVVTRPEIKDIKQLKGKKVGIIRFGGISELMVRYLFQKLGLDADKDIAIMQVGQARFASMEKRRHRCYGSFFRRICICQANRIPGSRYAAATVLWQHGCYYSCSRDEEIRCLQPIYEGLSGRSSIFSQR